MNFTPQVETAEISDAGLDSVSGGLAADASSGGSLHVESAGACVDGFAAATTEGVVAGVGAHSAH